MTAARFVLSILLLCGFVLLLAYGNVLWLAATLGCALGIEIFLRQDYRWLLPALLFCVVLALLEWIGHRSVTALPLKALLSYVALALCSRIMPWVFFVRSVSPRSRFFPPILFFLFIRHFTFILRDEALRSLTAYRLVVPHPLRHGGVRALAFSLDSFLSRCLLRAERIYAAQLLQGLAE